MAGAVLVAALAAFHPASGVAAGPAPFDASPREGVLLLANGETIEGKITRAGDFFVVAVPNGEIRIRVGDVEFACDNIEQGYARKRSEIRLGTAEEHLQLGQWCQRNGLLDRADQELAEAEASNPRHPMIPVLKRRLEIARHPPEKAPAHASPQQRPLSGDELDRIVRGMPPGTVETFTQTVQPLLMNHCASGGCHGPQADNGYRLLRVSPTRPAGRRATQRNLHATLQWVDRGHPAASKLLAAATQPHGAIKAPVFSNNEAEQYRQLAIWVARLAQPPSSTAPGQAQGRNPWPSQTAPTVASVRVPPTARVAPNRAQPVPPDGAADPASQKAGDPMAGDASPFDGADTGPLDDGERRISDPTRGRFQAPHRSPPKTGDPKPGFVPADPFDPAIFNRRYSPEKKGNS